MSRFPALCEATGSIHSLTSGFCCSRRNMNSSSTPILQSDGMANTTAGSSPPVPGDVCAGDRQVAGHEDALFCGEWNDPNHPMFQVGNILIVISLLALFQKPSLYWHLFERFFLSAGCFALTIWAWYVHCAPDIVLWNLIFGIMHLYYVLELFFKLRPIRYFDPDLETIRLTLFPAAPLHAYDKLMSLSSGIEKLDKGSTILVHGRENLRLVVSGKIQATGDGRVLYHASPLQFADSPSRLTHVTIPVSLMTVEKTRLLVWDSQSLHDISRDPELAPLLTAVVAADVAFKFRTFLDSVYKAPVAEPSAP